MRFFGL